MKFVWQARNSRPYPSMCFPTHIHCCRYQHRSSAAELPCSAPTIASWSSFHLISFLMMFSDTTSTRLRLRIGPDCLLIHWHRSVSADFSLAVPLTLRRVAPEAREHRTLIRSCSTKIWSADRTRARLFGSWEEWEESCSFPHVRLRGIRPSVRDNL